MANSAIQRAAKNRAFGPAPGRGNRVIQGKATLSPPRTEKVYPFFPVNKKAEPVYPYTIQRKAGE